MTMQANSAQVMMPVKVEIFFCSYFVLFIMVIYSSRLNSNISVTFPKRQQLRDLQHSEGGRTLV